MTEFPWHLENRYSILDPWRAGTPFYLVTVRSLYRHSFFCSHSISLIAILLGTSLPVCFNESVRQRVLLSNLMSSSSFIFVMTVQVIFSWSIIPKSLFSFAFFPNYNLSSFSSDGRFVTLSSVGKIRQLSSLQCIDTDGVAIGFLRGGEQACFQAMLCTLLSGSKWWSQVSPAVTNCETKLSGFSLNVRCRLVNASTRSAYWTSDNIRGTHCADTLFIDKFSGEIKCTLPVEMPTDATTKPTDSRRSVMMSLLTFATVSSSEVIGNWW